MSWKEEMRALEKKRNGKFIYKPGDVPKGGVVKMAGGNRYEVQKDGSLKRLFVEPDEPEQESQ